MIAAGCFASSAVASAWNIGEHHFLLISRADYFTSDLGEVSVMGAPVSGRFQRLETNNYPEFGLTSKLMLGGKLLYGTS